MMKKISTIARGLLLAISLSNFALPYLVMFLADAFAPAPVSEGLVLLSVGLILIFPILSGLCGILGVIFSSYCLYKKDSKVANIVWIVLFTILILMSVFYVSAFWDGAASV